MRFTVFPWVSQLGLQSAPLPTGVCLAGTFSHPFPPTGKCPPSPTGRTAPPQLLPQDPVCPPATSPVDQPAPPAKEGASWGGPLEKTQTPATRGHMWLVGPWPGEGQPSLLVGLCFSFHQ